MSCKHGNHEEQCDLCDEVDAAYEAGKKYVRATEMTTKDEALRLARERFEKFFVNSNRRGKKHALDALAKDEYGYYVDDSTQRHWWTWQNAIDAAAQPVASDRNSCCGHASDCAVHNAPAYPVGPCDCGLQPVASEPSSGERADLIEWLLGLESNWQAVGNERAMKLTRRVISLLSSDAKPASEQENNWRDIAIGNNLYRVTFLPSNRAEIVFAGPTSEPVAVPQGWHAPGLGEVHNEDHSLMIYCADTSGDEEVASDTLARTVCSALNALYAAPSQAPVGINGLTEAETNASASVMGLTKKENQ